MKEVERRETSNAELAPDCYAGDDCDQIKHLWKTSCEGDMGDVGIEETLILSADIFPPGTRVRIEEPVCPDCERIPTPEPNEGGWPSKCVCGFDWEAWTRNQYS